MVNNENCSVQLSDMSPKNDLLKFELACERGSNFSLSKSNSLRCKFKADFQTRYKAVSSVTKTLHDCIVPPRIFSVNCHSPSLACDVFDKQYVGEIDQKLVERFNGHKLDFVILKNMVLLYFK